MLRDLPAPARRLERRPPGGRGTLRGARARRDRRAAAGRAGPRLPHVLRPLVRARPARRRARRGRDRLRLVLPAPASPPARAALPRLLGRRASRRPRRRHVRISACRCGEGSRRSSRQRSSRCCGGPRASFRREDRRPDHPAPSLAARRRTPSLIALAWWGAFFLCFDQDCPALLPALPLVAGLRAS